MNSNQDIILPSADGKLKLSMHIETCENPKAIVMFSHGMAEHKERYYDFIHFLKSNHYLCVIHDHRGHGESVLKKEDFGYFYDDSGKEIVNDLHIINEYMKQQYPNLDRYLFSHSMGTLVSRNYIQKHDDQIKKMVLCGPPFNNKGAHLGYYLAKLWAKLFGDKYRSKLIHKMAFGSFDKKFGGLIENEWICSDQNQVDFYNQNPKCGYIFTINGFQCLFHLVKQCYKQSAYQVKNKQLKMLFISGEKDPVIGNQNKFMEEIHFMKHLGYHNISNFLYPELRHELLNEKNKEMIYQDILNFFESN
ncbi:MAG: alpha/beta fold hydrolase [Bacilli bacterium]|nr:alpha/beta fold hydrolase [Bacilli bacterium]